MNVLFLDIDGVLQIKMQGKKMWDGALPFTQSCVNFLNDVLEYADYKIVVISTWRMEFEFPALCKALQIRGVLAPVIDVTRIPRFDKHNIITTIMSRPDEIRLWLSQNEDLVERYAVLDDVKATTDEFGDCGVHVNSYEGVVRKTRDRLIDIFTSRKTLQSSGLILHL